MYKVSSSKNNYKPINKNYVNRNNYNVVFLYFRTAAAAYDVIIIMLLQVPPVLEVHSCRIIFIWLRLFSNRLPNVLKVYNFEHYNILTK